MPELLERTELEEGCGAPHMEVGACRVNAILDPQSLPGCEFFGELFLVDNLSNPSGEELGEVM